VDEKHYARRISAMGLRVGLGVMLLLAALACPCGPLGLLAEGSKVDAGATEMIGLFGALVVCMGIMAIPLYLTGAYLFVSLRSSLTLTAHALVYVHGRHTTRLALSEITEVSVSLSRRPKRLENRMSGHFSLLTKETQSRAIVMSLSGGGDAAAPFDTQELLRDLLPRLARTAHVDPQLLAYVETGHVPSSLTERVLGRLWIDR